MNDIKRQYVTASVVDSERVVVNLGGNKYRLVVKLWFPDSREAGDSADTLIGRQRAA
jgi:mRNA-degrading endonuclease HigB of HigAB toxin-antitoxin module